MYKNINEIDFRQLDLKIQIIQWENKTKKLNINLLENNQIEFIINELNKIKDFKKIIKL